MRRGGASGEGEGKWLTGARSRTFFFGGKRTTGDGMEGLSGSCGGAEALRMPLMELSLS